MSTLFQDLTYGLRQLRRNPGFTVVAVLTLALGMGANSAIFGLLYDTILARLPVSHPQEIVQLSWRDGAESGSTFNWPDYRPLLAPKTALPGLFAEMNQEMNLRYGDSSERVRAQLVSGAYFSTLQVEPYLGRTLAPADDRPAAEPAAVLSYAYWGRRFGFNPGALGQPIYISGKAFTIIGVTRPRFYGLNRLSPPDITAPLSVIPLPEGKSYFVSLFTRLEPGKPFAQAQAQLSVRFERLLGTELKSEQGWMGHVKLALLPAATGEENARLPLEEPLLVLEFLAGAVLLICLSNVVTLFLVRTAGRSREIAVRLALGATRWRTIRRLLAESVLVGVIGGAMALLVGYWIHGLLLTQLALDRSESLQFGLTAPVMIFTVSLSLLAGALVGLLPALRGSKMSINLVAKGDAPVGGGVRMRPMRAFLAAQVAASLVLLITAMLFLRTLRNLVGVNAGFDRQHVLLVTIDPKESHFHGRRVGDLLGRLQERVSAVPGVRSAAVSEWPLFGDSASKNVWLPGSPPGGNSVAFNVVGPGFFATNGVPMTMGRALTTRDRAGTPRVAVVNEAFVRKYFPRQNPVGRRFGEHGPDSASQYEIIGVVRDSRYSDLRLAPVPAIFIPFLQSPQDAPLLLTVCGKDKASGTASAVRRAIQEIDPGLVVYNVRTMAEQVKETLRRENAFAALSGLFAALALCLCCVGLYGVTAYSVSQRTHEIGIRMALGARKSDVLRMVVGQGLKLTFTGVVIGIAGALVLTSFLASLLYGVKPTDPLTFIAVSLILIMVALLACYIPARRAAKVDPMVALRYE